MPGVPALLQTPCQPGQLPPVPGAWQDLEHGQCLAEACSWPRGILSHGNEGGEPDCRLSVGYLLCSRIRHCSGNPACVITSIISFKSLGGSSDSLCFPGEKEAQGNESDFLLITQQLLSLAGFSGDPGIIIIPGCK